MEWMTLREICNVTKVSRRAIQGYEKAGLVQAPSRNNRGYLLYDEACKNTILKIKFLQDMGYSIKEIQVLFQSSNEFVKQSLKQKIEQLQIEKGRIDKMILVATQMVENL